MPVSEHCVRPKSSSGEYCRPWRGLLIDRTMPVDIGLGQDRRSWTVNVQEARAEHTACAGCEDRCCSGMRRTKCLWLVPCDEACADHQATLRRGGKSGGSAPMAEITHQTKMKETRLFGCGTICRSSLRRAAVTITF
jgi:hypothetical protein